MLDAHDSFSFYEIQRSIGVTQKTAWFMLHRIRLAMQSGTIGKLKGHFEVDETFIGDKIKNMHNTNGPALAVDRLAKLLSWGCWNAAGTFAPR
jgi:hypothetical protein